MSANSNSDVRFPYGDRNAVNNSLVLSSYDGEDSFVVLERSTANNDIANGGATVPQASFITSQVGCSFPVLSNHSSNANGMMTGSPFSNHCQAIPVDTIDASTVTSVSAEEIDKRLQEVLQENVNLKDNLRQTNLAMKQQLTTVSLLQNRALEAQKEQQTKFEEMKALILSLRTEKSALLENNEALNKEIVKLKEENNELNKTGFAFKEETAKLVLENAALQNQLLTMQETIKSLSEGNNKKQSLQGPTVKEVELRELVDQLSRKLEAVERARRQQEFQIDKLQAQLGRVNTELTETQRKLALTENSLQAAQAKPESDEPPVPVIYNEKLTKYDNLLKQLRTNIQEEKSKFNSLNSWLSLNDTTSNINSSQFEISELRRLLAEEQSQSVARKENLCQAASTLQEMLTDFQKLGEELECVKADYAVKESHGLLYEETKKKNYSEKIDALTAQLVQKEEALAISERHLSSLQEAVRLQHSEKKGDGEVETLREQIGVLTKQVEEKEEQLQARDRDLQTLQATKETVTVLEEQAKIYQADFEAERKSREQLAAEKDRLVEDLRHLQRRNEELLTELRNAREDTTRQTQRHSSPPQQQSTPVPTLPRPQDDVIPPPRRFYCPNPECNMMFTTIDPLQLHVITCLKLDD